MGITRQQWDALTFDEQLALFKDREPIFYQPCLYIRDERIIATTGVVPADYCLYCCTDSDYNQRLECPRKVVKA